MAKLTYFVLCEKYIFNEGKTTLVNVYDIVGTSVFPAAVKDFTIALAINDITKEDAVDGKIKVSVVVRDSAGEEFVRIESEQKVIDFPASVASGADLGGQFQFPKEDKFTGELYLNSKKMGELSFEVKEVEAK